SQPTVTSVRSAANSMANGGMARGGMARGGMASGGMANGDIPRGGLMSGGMASGASHGPDNPPIGVSDGPANSPNVGSGPRVSTGGTGYSFGNAPGTASDGSGGFPVSSSQNAGRQYPIGPPTGELQPGVGSGSANSVSGHFTSNGAITQSGDTTSGV